MLNEKELMDFLRVLAAFANATGLSATATGRVLGVSKKSMCRWLASAFTMLTYNEVPQQTVYRFAAANVLNQINRYNELHKATGLYGRIVHLGSTDKIRALTQALDEATSAQAV